MNSDALNFFQKLLNTPSPSGYESQIQETVRQYAADFADQVTTDLHGNVIAVRNPDAEIKIMMAGHCDQIGAIVQYIDDEGYLYPQPIGGWDVQVLLGQRVTVLTKAGEVKGVIARKPIHLIQEDERSKAVKFKELWVDIGAKDREEAEKHIRIGDPITVELGYRELLSDKIASPGMDDKVGVWTVFEALRRTDAEKLGVGLYAVSTVQEELGLRGARTSAFGIDPTVAIAVDVTFSTDCPTIDKKQEGDVRLGSGPAVFRGPNFNPKVVELLCDVAEQNKIDYQLVAAGRPPGTDANAMQVNRAGVATGLVSIPNRYMHSPVEVIHTGDLDLAADLLARLAESINPDTNFTP
jgi:tetrahedral aminopeptidase